MFKRKRFLVFGFIFLCLMFVGLYFLIDNYMKMRFFKGQILLGEVVIQDDSLGEVEGIICLGRYLILNDRKPLGSRGKIQVYDRGNYNLVASIGKEGSGPGEIRSAVALNYIPGDEFRFSIFDVSLNRLTIYSLIDGMCKVDKVISFEGAGNYYAHVINDSIIGVLDFLSDGRVSLYNFSGKKKETFGELLPGRKSGVPLDIHKAAMQGKLKVSPNSLYCILNATFSDFIDVYKDKKLEKRFHGPLKVLPRYKVESLQGFPVMALDTKRAIRGYIDIFVTNDYIYALYSGTPFKRHSGGKLIHIYSIDGRFVKTYLLDREVFGITLDPNTGEIFGIDRSLTKIISFKVSAFKR